MFIVLPNNIVQFIVMIFPGPKSWTILGFVSIFYQLVNSFTRLFYIAEYLCYLIINGYIFTLSVHLGHLKLYKFEEMGRVTNNFSQKNILGEGIYGIVCQGSYRNLLRLSHYRILVSVLQTMTGSLHILTCQIGIVASKHYKVSIMLHCHIFCTVATSSDVSHMVN